MSITLFAGNKRIIGLAKQADKDTPAASPTLALRVYNWRREAVRLISALEETDASTQQGASHVTGIAPGYAGDLYLRPSEADLIFEGLLGDETKSGGGPFLSEAIPTVAPPYFTVWEIEPSLYTARYEGCRIASATISGQDTGQTELRLTGLTFMPLGIEHGVAEPAGFLDLLFDELPFIWAEARNEYDGDHLGTTSAVTININRNMIRPQGDSGFTAIDVVPGKFQIDGTITRYMGSDDTLRAVDTGTEAGTVPTGEIFSESYRLLLDKAALSRSIDLEIPDIAYESIEVAVNTNGEPLAEVLGFRSQPQSEIADHIVITTENGKATTETAP